MMTKDHLFLSTLKGFLEMWASKLDEHYTLHPKEPVICDVCSDGLKTKTCSACHGTGVRFLTATANDLLARWWDNMLTAALAMPPEVEDKVNRSCTTCAYKSKDPCDEPVDPDSGCCRFYVRMPRG